MVMHATQRSPSPTRDRARSSARWALWAPMLYIVWFWVVFALMSLLTDLIGAYDWVSDGNRLLDFGAQGWLVAIVSGVLLAVPNWIGLAVAEKARRAGGGTVAVVGVWMNLVMGAGLALWAILAS